MIRPSGRLLHLAAVLFGVTLASFLLMDLLPGDPALALLGEAAAPEELAAVRRDLGLDRPLAQRYLRWLADVARGDLGVSRMSGRPVAEVIAARAPVSLALLLLAQAVALALALPLALACAHRPGGALDRVVSAAAFALLSLPHFVVALVLLLVFALSLGWLPAGGWPGAGAAVAAYLAALALPAITLGLAEAPVYLRVLRAGLLDALAQPFTLAARAKGLSARRVLLVHALRPASLSLVTLVGLSMGHLIAGAVVVETVFGLPGIGRALVDAVHARDAPLVQGLVLLVALVYVTVNALVDGLYGLIDPRIRAGAGAGAEDRGS